MNEDNYNNNSGEQIEEVNTPVETSSDTTVENSTNGGVDGSEHSYGENGSAKKQYSDLQKAQFSFHKQFSRQKQRYEAQLAERQRQFEELQARLDRLENPDKYRAKTRNDFSTDDEYIDHIVAQRFNKMMNEQMAAYNKQMSVQREQEEVENGYREAAQERVNKLYPDETSRAKYQKAIDDALEKGLGDLLDSDAKLAKYIIDSDYGPKILYELATNVNEVKNLFERGDEMDRQFKIRELEQRLKTQATQTQTVSRPVIGKPGSGTNTVNKSIYASTKSLLDFINS